MALDQTAILQMALDSIPCPHFYLTRHKHIPCGWQNMCYSHHTVYASIMLSGPVCILLWATTISKSKASVIYSFRIFFIYKIRSICIFVPFPLFLNAPTSKIKTAHNAIRAAAVRCVCPIVIHIYVLCSCPPSLPYQLESPFMIVALN